MLRNIVEEINDAFLIEAKETCKVSLEMPSGVTLQKKITENSKNYASDFVYMIEHGTKPGDAARDIQDRVRQTVKNLADKIDIVFEYKGEKYWAGK